VTPRIVVLTITVALTLAAVLGKSAGIVAAQDRSPKNACEQCVSSGAADCHAACMPPQTEPLGLPNLAWGECDRCTRSGAADCHAACMPTQTKLLGPPSFAWGECDRCTLSGAADCHAACMPPQTEPLGSRQIEIPLIAINNNYWLQAKVNHTAPVNFVLDTGASIVQIPEETAAALFRAGMLTSTDVRGYATTVNADGGTREAPIVLLHEIDVGGHIVRDVRALISPKGSAALLGQSFLQSFGSYTIDNRRSVLVLG
jgi:clan AA aspartic protease (TIGR02281 family)